MNAFFEAISKQKYDNKKMVISNYDDDGEDEKSEKSDDDQHIKNRLQVCRRILAPIAFVAAACSGNISPAGLPKRSQVARPFRARCIACAVIVRLRRISRMLRQETGEVRRAWAAM